MFYFNFVVCIYVTWLLNMYMGHYSHVNYLNKNTRMLSKRGHVVSVTLLQHCSGPVPAL